jgi:hypothetical protein
MHAMLLFYGRAYSGTQAPPPGDAFGKIIAAHLAYERDVLRAKAKVVVGQALQPASDARTVRFAAAGPEIEPGPFAVTDEALGGFYLIEVADLDEAVELAALYPMPPEFGCIEVRPIIPFDPQLRRQVFGDELPE